ncbi:MAG: HPr family phosphocarrier protein [Archangiaceae bacterium]|nr:HPr family phosphocarrier protein [Archangiaceae bacterium]
MSVGVGGCGGAAGIITSAEPGEAFPSRSSGRGVGKSPRGPALRRVQSLVSEATYTIPNALGLHARAAAQLVKAANKYPCEVDVECEGQTVNGKSIMGVLMLAAAQGMVVKVSCRGDGADDCQKEIGALINNKFGEPR